MILHQTSGTRRTVTIRVGLAAMEFAKHPSLVFAITIAFSLTTLANSVCIQKEDGASVQCCDQREHGGSVLCCSGRNSSCGMEDFVNNALCFCDEFCERAGDCCPDFESIREPCGFKKGKLGCNRLNQTISDFFSSLSSISIVSYFLPWPRLQIDQKTPWSEQAKNRDSIRDCHLNLSLFLSFC